MRCDSACRDRRCWRIGWTRTRPAAPRARASSQGDSSLGLLFKHGKIDKTYWRLSRAVLPKMKAPSTCRSAAERRTRLVAETGPGRPKGRDELESAGARRWPDLARAGAGHRAHPSIACALLRHGWPIIGDNIYGNGPAFRRTDPASAFPRNRDSDFQEQGTGSRGGSRAGAYARAAESMRVERRVGRGGSAAPDSSSSAKADDPVFQRSQRFHPTAAAYWVARSSRAMTADVRRARLLSHSVSRAPSCPAILSDSTAPGVSSKSPPAKSVPSAPCFPLSINT